MKKKKKIHSKEKFYVVVNPISGKYLSVNIFWKFINPYMYNSSHIYYDFYKFIFYFSFKNASSFISSIVYINIYIYVLKNSSFLFYFKAYFSI